MNTPYDAIIIGAGHNGLAAAIHLASRGWSVAIVEGHKDPGGAVKTAEVTLPGFRHDLGAMNLSLFAGSPFFAAYKDLLTAHGLGLVPVADCFASVFRDDSYLGVSVSLEKTLAGIEALSVADAAAWRRLQARFGAESPHIFGLLGAGMPSFTMAWVVLRALRQLGVRRFFEMARLLVSSPRDFLDAHFEHDKLKAMMAAWGLHLDFAPDIAGGALFPYLESMANQAFGMVIGQGGADTIITAMVGALKERNAALLTGVPVVAIEQSGGRATGVRLQDGRRLMARRAVIAGLHPQNLFGTLLAPDPARARFDARIKKFRRGPGAMMIHLALRELPDWRAGAALKRFAYVHIAPDMVMMAQAYTQAVAGLLPAEPVLVVGQPTAIDPSRAPAGQHVLWVQVRVLPFQIKGDAAGQIESRDWDEAREPYAARVLDIVERLAPGLRANILGQAIWSPLDLARDNPNLVGGDSLAGSHHLDQNFLFRPLLGASRYRTPVPGLYLCGASTWPGAGTGAGSGFLLAKQLAGP